MPSLFFLLLFLLPTQLGRHFWPDFATVGGIRVDYLAPTLYITDVLVVIMLGLWILPQIKTILPKISFLKQYFWGVIFISLLLIGIYFSKSPLAGIYGCLKLLELFLLGLYIVKKIDIQKYWANIIAILAIGGVFESMLGIAQFSHQASIGGIFWFMGERTFNSNTPGIANAALNGELVLRPYGTFPHPNVLAGYLIIVMTMIISRLTPESTRANLKKMLYGIAILFGTIALVLTMSRVAILVWFVIAISWFIFWFWQKFDYNKIQTALALIILIGTISAFFVYSPLGERVSGFNLQEESVTRRNELITSSLAMLREHPIIGVGLNNSIPNLMHYQKSASIFLFLQPVHNIYLLIASEIGIVGFIFFLWFIKETYKKIMKHQSSNIKAIVHNPRFILLLTVLVLGLFDHYWLTLQQTQLLFTIVVALGWAPVHKNLKQQAKEG